MPTSARTKVRIIARSPTAVSEARTAPRVSQRPERDQSGHEVGHPMSRPAGEHRPGDRQCGREHQRRADGDEPRVPARRLPKGPNATCSPTVRPSDPWRRSRRTPAGSRSHWLPARRPPSQTRTRRPRRRTAPASRPGSPTAAGRRGAAARQRPAASSRPACRRASQVTPHPMRNNAAGKVISARKGTASPHPRE